MDPLFQYLISLSPSWLRRHWEDRLHAQEKRVSLGEYRQRTSALSAQLNQILSRTPQWQQWSRKDRAVLFRHWYNEAFGGQLFVDELQKMSPQGLGRMLDRYTAIHPTVLVVNHYWGLGLSPIEWVSLLIPHKILYERGLPTLRSGSCGLLQTKKIWFIFAPNYHNRNARNSFFC